MSDARPRGCKVALMDGVEREILFTLAAVDEIQDHYNMPISEAMSLLMDERDSYAVLSYIAMVLINDSISRKNMMTGGKEEGLSLQQVKWLIDVPMAEDVMRAVMTAYGFSVPEADDDEEPDPN